MPKVYRRENTYVVAFRVAGALRYFWSSRDKQKAEARLQEELAKHPERLVMRKGTVGRDRNKWVVRGPRPDRTLIGRAETKWKGEQMLKKWLKATGLLGGGILLAPALAHAQGIPQQAAVANFKVIYIPSGSGTAGGACPASATCYPARGLTAANKVLFGLLLDSKGADLTTVGYSFVPSNWVAISNAVNPTVGWRTGANVLIDPASTGLGDLSALFVYQ